MDLHALVYCLFVVHFLAMALMGLYGLYRLRQILLWLRMRQGLSPPSLPFTTDCPHVLVQVPLYNERFVAARIIEAVSRLDWPQERLEIQVLDDSSDETKAIVDREVQRLQQMGVHIYTLRRGHREGFKAGALAHGMTHSSAPFIAIFDADFIPRPNFLRQVMPFFQNAEVGFVQARWDFLNEKDSWLTRIQAILLSAHFGVEQFLRYHRGLFMNFNGTAGVWRRSAIESAGGWSSDTVTEDLELSFRAYLKGWKAVYLNDLLVPSELPVTVQALKHQQKRWAKGSIQTARKLLPSIWRSSSNFEQKLDATMHLLGNCGWILGTIMFLTLYPALLMRSEIGPYQMLQMEIPLFLCATLFLLLYFYIHESVGRNKSSFSILCSLFLLPAFGIGIAPSVTVGILEGLRGFGGIFVRTPKIGNAFTKNIYIYSKMKINSLLVNFIFFAYSLLPVHFAIEHHTLIAIPLLFIFPLGFFLMFISEFKLLWHSIFCASRTSSD
jgi:cellulose synthase/poly-beta-1,6-N-acetylglucosamine synthase-like glycosyltransferase